MRTWQLWNLKASLCQTPAMQETLLILLWKESVQIPFHFIGHHSKTIQTSNLNAICFWRFNLDLPPISLKQMWILALSFMAWMNMTTFSLTSVLNVCPVLNRSLSSLSLCHISVSVLPRILYLSPQSPSCVFLNVDRGRTCRWGPSKARDVLCNAHRHT